MIVGENFRLAFSALRANKMRSILTALGIIIGVAAVIAVVSLVQGLEYLITQQLQGVGANFVMVFPDVGNQRPGVTPGAGRQNQRETRGIGLKQIKQPVGRRAGFDGQLRLDAKAIAHLFRQSDEQLLRPFARLLLHRRLHRAPGRELGRRQHVQQLETSACEMRSTTRGKSQGQAAFGCVVDDNDKGAFAIAGIGHAAPPNPDRQARVPVISAARR